MISKSELSKLQRYLINTEKFTAAKIVGGIVENYDMVMGIESNSKQIVE